MKTLVELFDERTHMAIMYPDRFLKAAELAGGTRLRQLAQFYISGELPDGDTVQTICADLANGEFTRPFLISMVVASGEGTLDSWGITPKFLSHLKEVDKEAFKRTLTAAIATSGNITAAAKLLGVGLRTMWRYVKEAGIES